MAKQYTVRDFARTYHQVELPNGKVIQFNDSLADIDEEDVQYFHNNGGQFEVVEHEAGQAVTPVAGKAPMNSVASPNDTAATAPSSAQEKQEEAAQQQQKGETK